eukprot:2960021-Amphidinium_carterae.1
MFIDLHFGDHSAIWSVMGLFYGVLSVWPVVDDDDDDDDVAAAADYDAVGSSGVDCFAYHAMMHCRPLQEVER